MYLHHCEKLNLTEKSLSSGIRKPGKVLFLYTSIHCNTLLHTVNHNH